jgi:hypothetical protein
LAGKLIRIALCTAMLMAVVLSGSAYAGEVEFKSAPEKFTIRGGAGTIKTMPGGNSLECKEVVGQGELKDVMTFTKTKLLFTGCAVNVAGIKFACTNVTATLKGNTGWIGETGKPGEAIAGAALETEAANELVAEFECSGTKVAVKGPGIVGELRPDTKLTKRFELDFKFAPTLSEAKLQKFQSMKTLEQVKESLFLKISLNGGAAEALAIQYEKPLVLETAKENELKP